MFECDGTGAADWASGSSFSSPSPRYAARTPPAPLPSPSVSAAAAAGAARVTSVASSRSDVNLQGSPWRERRKREGWKDGKKRKKEGREGGGDMIECSTFEIVGQSRTETQEKAKNIDSVGEN